MIDGGEVSKPTRQVLRKDGDFYLYKKDSMRSYLGAVKAKGLKNHLYYASGTDQQSQSGGDVPLAHSSRR